MKHLLRISFGLLFSLGVCASPFDDISSYGIYVAGNDGFEKLRPFQHQHFELRYLAELPSVEPAGDRLTLYVYEPEINPQNLTLRVQRIALVGGYEDLNVDVSPTDKADFYKVEVAEPVAGPSVLFANVGWWLEGSPAITLGDPEAQLEALFSDMTQPAHAALPELKAVLAVYPDNEQLQALLPQWEQQAKRAKDDRDFQYVDEAWQSYQGTERLQLQQRYLKKMQMEINGYLNNHPEGSHAETAAERRAYAEEKIKELETRI